MKINKLFFALAIMLSCLSFISISATPNLSKIDIAKLQNKAALLSGESNKLQYYINYSWNDEQWQPNSKESYNYDNLGRMIEVITSSRDNDEWVDDQKSDFEYYGDSDNIKKITSKVAPMGSFISFMTMEFKYDANWRITEQLLTVLIPNPYVKDTKLEYLWSNDLMTELIGYQKNESDWVEQNKSAYTYDTKKLAIEEIQYVWEGGKWIENFKNVNEYNASDSLNLITGYTWENSEWKKSSKTTYEYNGQLKTKESTFTWDTDWVNATQTSYNYNPNDELESDSSQNWVVDTWFNIGKNEYFYDSPNSVDEEANNTGEISIYPNPSSDFIMVKGTENTSASIMSIEGSAVIKDAKAGRIDISSLAPGMYYVVSGSKTGRFIKY
jgi:hypothetical protein